MHIYLSDSDINRYAGVPSEKIQQTYITYAVSLLQSGYRSDRFAGAVLAQQIINEGFLEGVSSERMENLLNAYYIVADEELVQLVKTTALNRDAGIRAVNQAKLFSE